MAKLTKGQTRTLTNENPKLRLNLKEMFGVDVSGSESLKQALGQALLDKMIERTQGGTSRFGKGFRKYSKQYIESDDFKAAGKSRTPNMTLSGDMLGTIELDTEGGNTVVLGWDDNEEAAKAHGHIVGANHLPKRDFFGLTASDIQSVKSEFSGELKDIQSSRGSNREAAILALINKVGEIADGES